MSFWSRGVERLGYAKNVDRLLEEAHSKAGLKKSLGPLDLITLGVAGIIGAGIFVLIGQGVEKAGVAVIPAFLLAAVICAFAGFAYAELAAAIPASGSAYAYLYTALGEFPGWLVAWALILEYAVGAIGVAIGWRNNFLALVDQIGRSTGALATAPVGGSCPATANCSFFSSQAGYGWTHSPFESVVSEAVQGSHLVTQHLQGVLDFPAIAIVALCTTLLVIGTKESARFTAVLVAIKVAILLMAIGVGFYLFQWVNITHEALPMAVSAKGFLGAVQAVFAAGAIMFFAYIGFDSVSTTAEETRQPKRDLPIGILGSLGITTVLYMLAAVALVGAAPVSLFEGDSATAQLARGEPFGYVFEHAGMGWAAVLVRVGALIGTTSVLLVLILGGVRVFFNMSRDGLLPPWMSRVSRRGAPAATTVFYGIMTAVFAGLLTLGFAVDLVNIGTLFAFLMVIVAAWVFRIRRPDVERPFRMPMWSVWTVDGKPYLPLFCVVGIIGTAALIFSLEAITLVAAVAWAGVGLLVYGLYGIGHSREAHSRHVPADQERPDPFSRGRPAGDLGGAAASSGQVGPYRHAGYTLYRRETGGKPVYFFSKAASTSGMPSPLPAGFEVGSNPKSGLPYLKRSL
ncbi:MAG: APC family permease [Thermoplasmatota archaeon]